MPVKLRKPVLFLGIASIAFAAFYAYARPNWRLLTEAEMRSTLRPELQVVEPADPTAQDRYRRFLKITAELGYDKALPRDVLEKSQRRIRLRSTEIQSLEKLVLEGPFQNPDRDFVASPSDPMYLTMTLAEAFAMVARLQSAEGDGKSATRNYRTAIAMAEQIANASNDWTGLGCQPNAYERIGRELFRNPVRLTDSELGEIARAIPPSSLDDPVARRLLLRDCQVFFPALIDPIEWTRKVMPEAPDPERLLAHFTAGNIFGSEESEAVLTYDARQTAEHLNRIVPVALANTGRSFRDQDRSMEKYGTRLTASYPANGAAGKTGTMQWLKRMEYRWATARVRNGLGDRVIEMLGVGNRAYTQETSFLRRAFRESTRTRIALHRYRLRYGRPAPDLAALVTKGLLPSPPLDVYDGASLRYDPKRNLLWSVGEDGKDGNGRAAEYADRRQPDIVWKAL